MARKSRTRTARRAISLLILIALFALLWPLNAFLAGFLAGGGRLDDPGRSEELVREPGNLRVTVLESDTGAPVEGAVILVRTHPGGTLEATSGETGEANLKGIPSGWVEVRAQRGSDISPARWTQLDANGSIALDVAPPARRQGRVLHADGTPADALVRLIDADGNELDRAHTDGEGRFDVKDLTEIETIVAETKQGALSLSHSYDLVIEEGELLQGRLLGARRGALEVFALVPSDEDRLLELRTRWALDDEGRYSGRLPHGARAYGMVDGLPVPLDGTERELPPRVRAVGRVVGADGHAPEGAEVLVTPELDPARSNPLPARALTVDAEGRFAADDLARVPYRVVARATGCATTIREDVRFDEGSLKLELAAGYTLSGVVLGAGEIPLARASVRARGLPDPSHDWPVTETKTDDRGRFTIPGVGGTHARLRVTAPGHHATTLENVRPGAALRITLHPR